MPKPKAASKGSGAKPVIKTWTLDAADLKRLHDLDANGDEFAHSLRYGEKGDGGYNKFGSLTDKQYDAFQKHLVKLDAMPKMKTLEGEKVAIICKRFLDDKPVCISHGCQAIATVAVKSTSGKAYVGMCQAHAEDNAEA